MDLSVYSSIGKVTKEKRERQPNWTVPEKQLLLSLTRMHQSILENKGSDTMTIKRKSQAWDEITRHMKSAGYNRSKERLKQQLGRIRAAKRAKEALERRILYSNSNSIEDNIAQSSENKSHRDTQEEIHIKVENNTNIDKEDYEIITDQRPSFSCYKANNSRTKDESVVHFMLRSVQSLNNTGKFSENFYKFPNSNSNDKNEWNGNVSSLNDTEQFSEIFNESSNSLDEIQANKTDVSSMQDVNNGPDQFFLSACSNTNGTNKDNKNTKSETLNVQVCKCGSRARRREQRLRQIHMYRIAMERERLRGLKLQQKRDHIIHRKDLQIQNLKLQILRNMINQNRDGNCINL